MCKYGFIFGAVLLMSTSAMAAAVLVDDFDGYSQGAVGTVTTNWRATADVTIEPDPDNAENQVIRMQENTGVQKAAYCILSADASIPEGATKTLFLRFRATSSIDCAWGLSYVDAPDVGGSDWGQFGPQVSVLNGNFRVRNGSAGWPVVGPYTALQWYNLWMVVDNASDTMQVYLHSRPGERATEADRILAGTADTFGFRNTTTSALHRFYWRAQNPGGELYVWIDDIYMVDGKSLAVPGAAKGPAGGPRPDDKATDVLRDATLSWTPGLYAMTHDVYLGTSFDDVNTASVGSPLLVSQGQDANSYQPTGRFDFGQTYYWRVDEVNAPAEGAVYKGEVWSFTVEPESVAVDGNHITATASSSGTADTGPEKTIDGSGLNASDQHSTNPNDMWVSSGTDPSPAWIQYAFDKPYVLDKLLVWNSNQSLEVLFGFGAKDVTVEYSVDGAAWTTLGDFVLARAPGAPTYTPNSTISFGRIMAQYVKLTIHTNWGGALQQKSLSEVRFLAIPVAAREPTPAVGATDVAPQTTLTWRAGRLAASHEVYLGMDSNAVADGTAPMVTTSAPAYDATLDMASTYYWKVVEVNAAEDPVAWDGDVWSFSTADYIVVDDFESYTNNSPKRVFQTWIDGAGFSPDEFFPSGNPGNATGAIVGNDPQLGNIMETTVVHGGVKSMPFFYDNTTATATSETTRTFATARDWTKSAVTTLTLYFYGDVDNTGSAPLWVKLTDQSGKSATATFGAAGEDVTAMADQAWTEWNMPLSGFAGIDLTKVASMTVGVGPGTASGQLFLDDIRLYPQREIAAPITPVLVGHWKLDNNAQDSSGNGNNGTLSGGPTYVAAGRIGAALSLDGTDDYVDCGNDASLNITDTITLSAWINPADVGNAEHNPYVAKGDTSYSLKHHTSNYIQFVLYRGGTWYTANGPVLTSDVNGSWHHVAGTYDGTQMKFYMDGQVVASRLVTLTFDQVTYNVQIGHDSQNTDRYYRGDIDDVRIYHGALPKSEVVKLANP
jgi:hypothetical protein